MRITVIIVSVMLMATANAEDIYYNPPSEEGAWPFLLDLPECDDQSILRKIMHDFENREREYWASKLYISKFENIKELGNRTHGLSYTPRRYCQSEAIFSDSIKRSVFYNLTPDQSVILTGQVIDWCVVGLDRAHVDGPNCQRVTAGQ